MLTRMTSTEGDLPDIGTAVAPILATVAPEHVPLFVALLERSAARRYERWAAEVDGADARTALLACAARENEIGAKVEALFSDAVTVQAELVDTLPDIDAFGESLFGGRPLVDQFTIQARGERLGIATWKSLARQPDGDAAKTYLACADLEEASAVVLEGLIASL